MKNLLLGLCLLVGCNDAKNEAKSESERLKAVVTPVRMFDINDVVLCHWKKPPTDENIMLFLIESQFEHIIENFCVARKETGNGRAGIGKKYNNHHGLKRASTYQMFTDSISTNNDLYFDSWVFSYMNYNERRKKYKAWCNWQVHREYADELYKKVIQK